MGTLCTDHACHWQIMYVSFSVGIHYFYLFWTLMTMFGCVYPYGIACNSSCFKTTIYIMTKMCHGSCLECDSESHILLFLRINVHACKQSYREQSCLGLLATKCKDFRICQTVDHGTELSYGRPTTCIHVPTKLLLNMQSVLRLNFCKMHDGCNSPHPKMSTIIISHSQITNADHESRNETTTQCIVGRLSCVKTCRRG